MTRVGCIAWLAAVCCAALISTDSPAHGEPTCAGDCNGDATVTIDELITCVNIDLGSLSLNACPACNTCPDCGTEVTVDEILGAVNNAFIGCPLAPTPTPTCTLTPVPPTPSTATPTPFGTPTCGSTPTCGPYLQVICVGQDPRGCPAGCGCDGPPTPTPPPTCAPTPTPARLCSYFYEPYRCAVDQNGCSTTPCDCCNFEDVGGCCQYYDRNAAGGVDLNSPRCFRLQQGSDLAYCMYTLYGQGVSGCPISVSCNSGTGYCERP